MIAQFSIEIDPTETVESLRQKIRQLEHFHYPLVIQNHILKGEN
jgi:folate-dependent phosphoribosylglycinamide formyltransferase PurN